MKETLQIIENFIASIKIKINECDKYIKDSKNAGDEQSKFYYMGLKKAYIGEMLDLQCLIETIEFVIGED